MAVTRRLDLETVRLETEEGDTLGEREVSKHKRVSISTKYRVMNDSVESLWRVHRARALLTRACRKQVKELI